MTKLKNEKWVKLPRTHKNGRTIVALSNYGRIKYATGEIENTKRYQTIYDPINVCKRNVNMVEVYKLVCYYFPEEDLFDKNKCIDHIKFYTKYPNARKNLRQCTHKENANFAEAKLHHKLGRALNVLKQNFPDKYNQVMTNPKNKYERQLCRYAFARDNKR